MCGYERKNQRHHHYLTVLVNPPTICGFRIQRTQAGIGTATVEAALEFPLLWEFPAGVLRQPSIFRPFPKKGVEPLCCHDGSPDPSGGQPLGLLLEQLLEQTGYRMMLEGQGLEGSVRMENILELKSNLMRYEQENPEGGLSGFLEEIALYTDLDNYDPGADAMVLMTIHAAKGLEFNHVFIAGMDEGIFPGRNALNFPPEIEEERRLAYVAITWAKKSLVITSAQRRLLFGQTVYNQPSRFIQEIPKENANYRDHSVQSAFRQASSAPKVAMPSRRAIDIGVGRSSPPKPAGQSGNFTGKRCATASLAKGWCFLPKPWGDTLLEVEFSKVGIKKIMANYARLSRIKGIEKQQL